MCSNLLSHHFVLSFCLFGNSLLVSLVNVLVSHDIEVSYHDGFPCRHGRYGSGSFPGGGKEGIHGESIGETIGFFTFFLMVYGLFFKLIQVVCVSLCHYDPRQPY